MSSVCISNCINDASASIRPVRTTYVSLYKWPESDAEFVRSVRRGGGAPAARVVDSISCRQMYLRSYTFSREDDDKKNKNKKETSAAKSTCLGRAKETVSFRRRKEEEEDEGDVVIVDRDKTKRRRKRGRPKRKKRFACSALFRLFQRLLSCAATVDVVDHV
ncbi:PREDICTED: uncharacterized protein LOC104826999 [Tarenaya hassleriana]|uniref:uncharacterized protein LOC104826999 n=1 Tax=Tarenaya hassleriana TaxID=28532 RepID=UPI00053C913F|nr:PREDICTED: uncharacterized protein LOC104826999 [Tarenaya hassleriana]